MKPDNEQKQQQAATAASVQVSSQGKVASVPAIDRLKEFGGFSFLENIIDGYSPFCRRLKVISPVTLSDHVRQVYRWQSGSSADFAGRNSYSHNQMMFSGSVRRTSGRLHLLISLPHSLKNQIRLFFCHPLLFSKAMPPKTSFYFLR